MTIEPADLKRLRLPLAAALLLTGIGAAAFIYSESQLADADKQHQAAQARLRAGRDRLAKVTDEEREIRANLVQFRQLAERRMVGEEKRVEWIETLAAIRQQRRLFELRYNLEPRRAVDYAGLAQDQKAGSSVFMASRMKLELSLLHEGDLLNFLTDLRTSSATFASLRSCSITRADAGGGGGPQRPRLHANCVVDMITLMEPEKK